MNPASQLPRLRSVLGFFAVMLALAAQGLTWHVQQHGSTRFLLNTNGSITDTYAYDAYGLLISSTGSTTNNYLYCSQQFDSDLQMYYLRARYYKPDSGRFWTMDSYEGSNEDPLSLHKYLYCQNDPMDRIDPSGHNSEMGSYVTTMFLPLTEVRH